MIRLMTIKKGKRTTITVDGQVTGDCVATIETFVKQASAGGGLVNVFLRDVCTIDADGRALLSRLAAEGVHLRATGVYSSYVVAEINRFVRSRSAA